MPKSARGTDKPLERGLDFSCERCRVEGKARVFRAVPGRVEDDASPEQAHHPYRYFAPCPSCGEECEPTGYQRALLKAWASATGPRTEEGKAASAKNLEGHPTPEEALRTRFNAMKHGLSARVATYFPAKPDGYAFCASCDVDREWCAKQPACVKRAENFLLHHAAFQQRRPELLSEIHGDMHAAIFSVVQQILQSIMAEGVRLKNPVWYSDKDGGLHFVQFTDADGAEKQVYELSAHPLIKPLTELLKAANLSLSDMGQTVRVADGGDEEELGRLRGGAKSAPEEIGDYQRMALERLESLKGIVERARAARSQDPVLLEHNAQTGTYEPAGGGGS